MGVIDCQFLIYEFNFMGNFSLEEIPSDGLENVYGQPQTTEQRNTMIGNSNSFFVHCFCQTKITSIVRFLGRKENSIEKWFITRRGLWFSIPRWGFSQQKTQNATQVINLPPDYVDHTSVLKLIQNDIIYANGYFTVTLHSYILIKSERNIQYTVDFLWPVNGVLHSLSQN